MAELESVEAGAVEGGVCDGGDAPAPMAEKVNGTECETDNTTKESDSENTTPENTKDTTPVAEKTIPAPPVAKPKYRYDWYQTEADVCINILIKKVKKENVQVDFKEKSVSARIEVREDDIYNLELALAHQINLSRCSIKVYGTKIELRMRKCEGLHWESLEHKTDEGPKLKLPASTSTKPPAPSTSSAATGTSDDIHKYPSSSHYTRDWDKLVAEVKKEEKEEKPEGDAALNKLFQQIYKDGNDEVRKAMNKSFVESGGTVLSTNWGEIGNDKVERKPPDGMEWKEYEK